MVISLVLIFALSQDFLATLKEYSIGMICEELRQFIPFLFGTLERVIAIQAAPSRPFLAADFTGDGLTDLIMTSKEGIFGYAQVRRPGGIPFSILLALLMIAMIAVYATHQTGAAKSSVARSTDRVD